MELSQNDSPGSECSGIKTFAFFDLETTGLPDLEFFKTKITELSIIAVSVDHLTEVKDNEDIPRVQQKLTLCFNPFKRIDIKATEITGLDNDLLEHQKKFDKNAMNMIECFLFQLEQPVCLIAHNGNSFDFPLIKKQYEILNGNFPFSLKVCDSLPVFKQIDEINEKKLKALKKKSFSLKEWQDALNEGFVFSPEIENILDSGSSQRDGEPDQIFQVLVKQEIEKIEKLEQENRKPTDDQIKSLQAINEHTPNKPTTSVNLQPNDQQVPEKKFRATSSKLELFPSTSTQKARRWAKGKYTLREIYKRFYSSHPEQSHDAESDVVSLMKCVIACKTDFVRIVNEECVQFSDVKKF